MIKGLKCKKKGFSLVELIVVIAIIGILAAIAVPKYSQYQKTAKEKADVATAEALANATSLHILNTDTSVTTGIEFTTDSNGDFDADTKGSIGSAVLATMAKKPLVKRDAGDHYKVEVSVAGIVKVTILDSSDADVAIVYGN